MKLTEAQIIEALKQPIGKALALIAPGMQTFGRWPSPGRTAEEQKQATATMRNIAMTYAVACANDPKITAEIIECTARRYLQGEVTIWENGVHVPATAEFPTAPQFRNACIQTWHHLYRIVAIGEKIEDGAKVLVTRVERRDDPQPGVAALEAPATPEQVAAIKTRLERLPSMPSLSEAVTRREPRVVNQEAEAELARIREAIRREA